jgi:hypothetical protein
MMDPNIFRDSKLVNVMDRDGKRLTSPFHILKKLI